MQRCTHMVNTHPSRERKLEELILESNPVIELVTVTDLIIIIYPDKWINIHFICST